MGDVIPINSSALKTKLDYALAYAAIGWHVFPLHWITNAGKCSCGSDECSKGNNAGKHPFGSLVIHAQNDATIDQAIIKRWWSAQPNANIGVALFKSNLCALDIDPRNGGHETIEILEDKYGAIYSDVMAFTGGGGEHRVFSVPQSMNFPGTLGKGIDIKYNGYIVVEPSNHKSGNTYEWEGSSAPYDFNAPSPLPDWIRDLAYQKQASESSNTFISRFVTDNQIEELRSALTAIDADDRDTWIKVGTALKTIGAAGWNLWLEYSERSAKFNLSDQRRVWHSFKPHSVSYETVFYLAQEAGWVNMPTKVESIIDLEIFKPKKQESEQLNKLPGVLGDIEDYFNATAYIPQPAFAQQTAWAIASTLLGRRFRSTYDHYSSLYFACIAPSACGKEHVKTVATDIFAACEKDLLSGDGYTSAGGVISSLKEKPCHLSIIDEFGLYLEASNNKNNINGREANTLLMECIARVKKEIRSKNYSTKTGGNKTVNDVILRPAISLVGLTTPSTFYKNLSIEMIADGFFGRFLTVTSKMPRVAPRMVRPVSVPQSILDWSSSIDSRIDDKLNSFANFSLIGDQCVIDVSDDAIALLYKFSVEMVELMNTLEAEGIEALAGRSAELAGRLAFIAAFACDPYTSMMTEYHASIAIDYVRRLTLDSVADIRSNLFGSVYEKAKKDILDAIRLVNDGVTESEMHRKPPFSKFKDKELAEIIQALVKSELIALVNTREGKPGKPRIAFIAVESVKST